MAKNPIPQPFVLPKTLGACADTLYTLREERRKAQRAVDEIEACEALVREHIIQTLPKSETTGVSGKLARVSVVSKTVCQVVDWTKFYAFIKKHNAWELLQRRVSEAPVKERWDDQKKVDGVEPLLVPTLSLNKL